MHAFYLVNFSITEFSLTKGNNVQHNYVAFAATNVQNMGCLYTLTVKSYILTLIFIAGYKRESAM